MLKYNIKESRKARKKISRIFSYNKTIYLITDRSLFLCTAYFFNRVFIFKVLIAVVYGMQTVEGE